MGGLNETIMEAEPLLSLPMGPVRTLGDNGVGWIPSCEDAAPPRCAPVCKATCCAFCAFCAVRYSNCARASGGTCSECYAFCACYLVCTCCTRCARSTRFQNLTCNTVGHKSAPPARNVQMVAKGICATPSRRVAIFLLLHSSSGISRSYPPNFGDTNPFQGRSERPPVRCRNFRVPNSSQVVFEFLVVGYPDFGISNSIEGYFEPPHEQFQLWVATIFSNNGLDILTEGIEGPVRNTLFQRYFKLHKEFLKFLLASISSWDFSNSPHEPSRNFRSNNLFEAYRHILTKGRGSSTPLSL